MATDSRRPTIGRRQAAARRIDTARSGEGMALHQGRPRAAQALAVMLLPVNGLRRFGAPNFSHILTFSHGAVRLGEKMRKDGRGSYNAGRRTPDAKGMAFWMARSDRRIYSPWFRSQLSRSFAVLRMTRPAFGVWRPAQLFFHPCPPPPPATSLSLLEVSARAPTRDR